MTNKLKMGSLGGPNTFGAEAAHRFLELYPIFDHINYFNTTEDAMRFETGKADALCAPQQMSKTGPHARMQGTIARQGSKLYVLGEVFHAYHCSLLVKPGTKKDAIKRILGHTGSVTQCQDWLDVNVPQAGVIIVDTSSMGAAKSVVDGDGSTASIGTPGMAREWKLEQLYIDIDNHSIGSYWAISPHAIFEEHPDRVVVSGRFGGDGRVGKLIAALEKIGLSLETPFALTSGKALAEYDYNLHLSGAVALEDVRNTITAFPEARVSGAFLARDNPTAH